jgi:hypothetical protein
MATLSKNGKKLGRPEIPYEPEVGDAICELLATTSKGLKQALDDVNAKLPADKPKLSLISIYRWIERNEPFREQYARARELQAQILHDHAQHEAETTRPAILRRKGKRDGKDFEESSVSDNVQRSRLIVDTELKRASQLWPKRFGEPGKNSGDGDAPVKIQIELVGAAPKRAPKPPPEFCLTPEILQLPKGD